MKKFLKPDLKIIKLEAEDIVCTSSLTDGTNNAEKNDQGDYGDLFA